MRSGKIPATVVTGFLGAGKTTLVNHILEATRPLAIGVIVNEFGEVGIDGQLIVADETAVIEINNGCICCTVRTDLVGSVREMLDRFGDGLQRLVVETSGLADPAPVLQTFLADPDVRERVELESVIAVVDALHAQQQLADDIAREQIVFADRIVVNKTDVASPDNVTALVESIRQLNPTATVDLVHRSTIDVGSFIGVRSFSIDNLLAVEPDLLDEASHDHEHDESIESHSFVVPGAVDAGRFGQWVNAFVQKQGQQILRMKGVLNLHDEARRLHFHSVHMLMDTTFGKAWSQSEPRDNRFVMIGRNLDARVMRDGLLGCMH
ncbi:CobW family GTP-binding protein [Paraburkholderia aromaticivorans]|uniref:Cobalamin biosynthesis protein CobW n=1 Tax=Paraburkholderia aromaticivorans TaxID=2026199 RepID=A0A248VS49_9BURK|nr:GTP-binding protein [Paraburkholderia aromaticivorans]ASW01703.1 cobalamin biosynthesis protein CobW [Paraburkholderia aromaticivorans]